MSTVLKDARSKKDLKDITINDYDLIFMPIIWSKHFYIICFNLRSYKVDVLDNSASYDDKSIVKYMTSGLAKR
ncbi:putative Ulp1 protease family catalytic domain, papain-like cysteine peptidase superfamily [Helianthus anomalus]